MSPTPAYEYMKYEVYTGETSLGFQIEDMCQILNSFSAMYAQINPPLETFLQPKKLKALGKASKKNVKLGLLAEVRGEGSDWVLGAQPVIRSVF